MAEDAAPHARIVVGMDFSPAALRAAQLALETAGHLSASVHMVNVWQPPQLLRTDVMLWVDDEEVPLVRHAEAAAEKRFAEALAQLDTGSVPVTTRFAVGHAADVLTEESDVPGTELICLGTHGTSFLERALVGSVASQVIRRAHCPVLTVRDSWAAPGSH